MNEGWEVVTGTRGGHQKEEEGEAVEESDWAIELCINLFVLTSLLNSYLTMIKEYVSFMSTIYL